MEIVSPLDAFTATLHSRYAGNLLQKMEARQTGNIKPHYKLPYIHYPIVSTMLFAHINPLPQIGRAHV